MSQTQTETQGQDLCWTTIEGVSKHDRWACEGHGHKEVEINVVLDVDALTSAA